VVYVLGGIDTFVWIRVLDSDQIGDEKNRGSYGSEC